MTGPFSTIVWLVKALSLAVSADLEKVGRDELCVSWNFTVIGLLRSWFINNSANSLSHGREMCTDQ